MGTSFECNIAVSSIPATGQLVFGFGPLEMGNLAEMLDYLASQEFRDCAVEAAARALTTEDDFVRVDRPRTEHFVHLRGITRTACGLDTLTLNHLGKPVAAVASVTKMQLDLVTCEACRRAWIEAHS